jgi:UDP-4-amino-4,6-dideoxy-N-acetyl-beta-L-altrosamine N-acetyltransferase
MMDTPGIKLRELERTDLPLLNRWRNDPEQIAPLGGAFRHVALGADERWYDAYAAARANNVRLAICEPAGAMVGVVYLLDIDWVHRDAEFAIWIGDPAWRGKHCGERATRMALAHAFDDLNLERVHLEVLSHNERAIRLYERIGFQREGLLRNAVFKRGQRHDLVLMALLRDEHARAGG